MAGLLLAGQGRRLGVWVVAGLLAVLAGCTTLPAPADADPPLPSSSPVLEPAAVVASESAPKSRLADFLAKRLHKKAETPVVPDEVKAPEASEAPEAPVDEKYRLTGEAALQLERGHASWYGGKFHGRRTASGENYNKYALTAAHKTLPFGTIVRVRSVALGREVNVRINDRGPFAPGRVIDVSQAAAKALGLMGAGVTEVSLQLGDALDEALSPAPSDPKIRKARTARRR
jgi:rare lipoprotein A